MRGSGTKRPDSIPTAAGEITRLACEHAAKKGLAVDVFLRKAGLTAQQIEDPDARLEIRRQIKFLNLVAAALNDDLFGFHLAQNFDFRKTGLVHYVIASSDTLNEAIRRIVRYSSIVNEGIRLTQREGKGIGLAFEYVGVSRHLDRHQIEFWMAALMRSFRQLTHRRLTAAKVTFIHQRRATPELRSFYGCEIRFGADMDETTFPGSIRNIPLVSADLYLNKLLIRYCEEALAHRNTNRNPFGTRVENAISVILPHGKADMSEVARKLGMSRRTLARRLESEGLSFTEVLTALRSDLARRHLADQELSISKIAWLLGYSDVSAFSNAYKRKTGMPPGRVRRRLRTRLASPAHGLARSSQRERAKRP
jgi:AraC-like DNA-binding protein